jgi:hypothetical protein
MGIGGSPATLTPAQDLAGWRAGRLAGWPALTVVVVVPLVGVPVALAALVDVIQAGAGA